MSHYFFFSYTKLAPTTAKRIENVKGMLCWRTCMHSSRKRNRHDWRIEGYNSWSELRAVWVWVWRVANDDRFSWWSISSAGVVSFRLFFSLFADIVAPLAACFSRLVNMLHLFSGLLTWHTNGVLHLYCWNFGDYVTLIN